MVQVVWAEPALADLKEIYQFIARDSPRYAQITVEKITRTAARLRTFPRLGEVLAEFPARQYRQLVVGAYRLIYREDAEHGRIFIMGVIHASRNLPPLLENR